MTEILSSNYIRTARLLLRRPTKEDDLILEDLWRSENVRKFLGGVISEEMIKQRILTLQEHWNTYEFGQYAVFEIASDQIVGLCGLHHSDDGIEISYMFFSASWGIGYATEAVIENIHHGLSQLNLGKIIAITQEANSSSCRLLERVGMQHVNTIERFGALQRIYSIEK